MAREKKSSKPVTIRMDISIYDQFKGYCNETGLSKTVAIERAIKRSIVEYK